MSILSFAQVYTPFPPFQFIPYLPKLYLLFLFTNVHSVLPRCALVLSHQSMLSASESVSLKKTNSPFPRSHQYQVSPHDPVPIHAGILAGKSCTGSPSGCEFMWVTGLSCLMILCALTRYRFLH